ncbi:DNA-binding beta-propeller fold protein YncE [Nocardioides ginsengisegetis]|uniref:DNA-binding beta-propeller fold protein YncE n=1 Tax=Nocardioides ginsengisegetis TaxID=661491 RepID=A0A7W3PAC2_9ACTN|nr:ScyD/ScyE family protein [Nocardioides ginsengisegetis]MBA8804585.1 DNA-binding beta-propeller fold protein YncE [Nocardioides ginsengisegetis]
MRTPRLLAITAASALALGALSASPAGASRAHDPLAKPSGKVVLARGLVGPLTLAVEGKNVYVTQNFTGELDKVAGGKATKVYASKAHNEVGGVSVRDGRVLFAETEGNGESNTDSWLKLLRPDGKARTLAHIRAFENANNPDGVITYGMPDISDECAAQWPTDQFGPPVYEGQLDSHPYATLQTAKTVYVADAGMNAVLAIADDGTITSLAVTPAVPVEITADLATALGAPDCVVGLTYYGESVPTDVEMGPDGKLYVTTLGGGLGEQLPLGAVYKINPKTGHMSQILSGLFTPTGIAVTPKGNMLIAELFANKIVKVRHGETAVHTWTKAPLPAAVEINHRTVFATIDALPPDQGAPDGKVVRYLP